MDLDGDDGKKGCESDNGHIDGLNYNLHLGKGYSVLLAVCSAIWPASFGRILPFCMGRTFWRMNGLMNGLTFGHMKRSFIC
jgi:hypothetical protein